MVKKTLIIITLTILFALLVIGCPKKTVLKEGPSEKEAEELALERERAKRLEAERAEREKALQELEAKRTQALKELEAERERAKRLEAERAEREKALQELEAKRTQALKELEAQREQAKRLEAEKKALEELEAKRIQALKELEAERERAKRLEAERAERERALREKEEALKREFEKSLVASKTPGIEGEVFESSMLKDIHFDFDRYDIRPQDAEILKEIANLLKKFPSIKIQIEGHCDERGTNEYNLALGERRANSAKEYLTSLGISPERISTISYGEERPLDPSHNEEAWAKNRRAHFVILSK